MISTITTAVSTIVSSSAVVGLVGSLGSAALITLLAAVVIKELATHRVIRLRLFSQNLSVVSLPLLFVFSFIFSIKIWEALS